MQSVKRLGAALLCVLIMSLLILPASAHHGHGGGHHGCSTPVDNTTASAPAVPAAVTVCPVEGCTTAGRHTHNGVTYCGANHAGGYCDGSCPYYQGSASSGVRYGGHHGCHR